MRGFPDQQDLRQSMYAKGQQRTTLSAAIQAYLPSAPRESIDRLKTT